MKNLYCLIRRVLLTVFVLLPASTFAITYTLTLQTNGSGTAAANPSYAAYPANSTVTLTATANGGWYFAGWSGDVTGSSNSVDLQMNGNKVVAANFSTLPNYTLTVTTNGAGTVALSPSGGSYVSNTVVQMTATPSAGWVFTNWTGDGSGTNNPLSITMNNDKYVQVNFGQLPAIDVPPQNVSTNVGGEAVFTSDAIGSSPLQLQWWFNGGVVGSGTELDLTDVQLSQAGTYYIVASNAYGITSNSAVLSVTNVPSGTNIVATATESALLAAIQNGGVVTFGFNGTINITNTINLTNSIVLDGTGRAVALTGGNQTRLFQVNPGVTFSASNLTLMNGANIGASAADMTQDPPAGLPASGGAIYDNGGAVYLTGCILASNFATGGDAGADPSPGHAQYGAAGSAWGGALYVSNGVAFLNSVTFLSNSVAGGGINEGGGVGNALGGAVYATNSTVTVLAGNTISNACLSLGLAAGAGFCVEGGTVLFSNCLISDNFADGAGAPGFGNGGSAHGGGVAIGTGAQAVLFECDLYANNAQSGNGSAYANYGPPGAALGGAVYSAGNMILSNSVVIGNQVICGGQGPSIPPASGAGIYTSGTASILGTVVASNAATGGSLGATPGGGPLAGAAQGGGIFNAGLCGVTNCTVALNTCTGGAALDGGLTPGHASGGGLYGTNGTLVSMNVTVASNSVAPGAPAYFPPGMVYGTADGANVAASNGIVSFDNTIIAYPGTNHNIVGTVTDNGHNICSDSSANFSSGTSFNSTDPLLGPLTDNGGATLTMAITTDSPAVDFGASAGAPLIDQRGLPRPAGDGFDIGAFELQYGPVTPTLHLSGSVPNFQVSFYATSGSTYVLQTTTSLATPNWVSIQTNVAGSSGPMTMPVTYTNSPRFFRVYMQ